MRSGEKKRHFADSAFVVSSHSSNERNRYLSTQISYMPTQHYEPSDRGDETMDAVRVSVAMTAGDAPAHAARRSAGER